MPTSSKTHHFRLENTIQHTQVELSDFISIELPESSTSGYRWQLAPHVQLEGVKLLQQDFSSITNTSKGTRTFVFCPTGEQSQASLEFYLTRSSGLEKNALQRFNLNVDIKKKLNS